MSEDTATVTLTGPENLIRHIEALQRVITERNARITHLEAQLGGTSAEVLRRDEVARAIEKAYRTGAKDLHERHESVLARVQSDLYGVRVFKYDDAVDSYKKYARSNGIPLKGEAGA